MPRLFRKPIQYRTELETGEVINDFRKDKLKWGWNILSLELYENNKKGNISGIGTGLKTGEYIAMSFKESVYAYKIDSIKYDNNPTDLFKAELSGVYELEDGDLI